MSKRTLTVFVVLLLVGATAGLHFFLQQRVIDIKGGEQVIGTGGWETYRNDEYKYEFKHPSGTSAEGTTVVRCVTLESYLGVEEQKIEEVRESYGGYTLGPCFSGHTIENQNGLAITDWMRINRAGIIKSSDTQKDIMFQSVPALLLQRNDRGTRNDGMNAFKELQIYFFKNHHLYFIHFIAPPENPTEEWRAHPYYQYLEKSVPITQAIIDSFRFVE